MLYLFDPAYVYVAAAECGILKIGMAADVPRRVKSLTTDWINKGGIKTKFALFHHASFDTGRTALFVEATAQEMLSEYKVCGMDWFEVDTEIAISSVNSAIELVISGHVPRRYNWRGSQVLTPKERHLYLRPKASPLDT